MFTRVSNRLTVVALCGGALFAAGAGVLATRRAPIAPVVAVVDVKVVLNGLDEQKQKKAEFEKRIGLHRDGLKKLDDERTADETRIKAMAAGPTKTAALQAYREKFFRAGIDKEFNERMMAEDEVNMLRDLYNKIDDAAEALAKKNGYHLVLSSDENMPIPGAPPANIDQISQSINLKRMLYVDPQLNITEELIQYMNNQFQAGGAPAAKP